jgi:hypothetical protein
VSQWGDVATNFAEADFSSLDFSPSTLQSDVNYIASDPGGAFDAAKDALGTGKDAVIGYMPKMLSNWNPH